MTSRCPRKWISKSLRCRTYRQCSTTEAHPSFEVPFKVRETMFTRQELEIFLISCSVFLKYGIGTRMIVMGQCPLSDEILAGVDKMELICKTVRLVQSHEFVGSWSSLEPSFGTRRTVREALPQLNLRWRDFLKLDSPTMNTSPTIRVV